MNTASTPKATLQCSLNQLRTCSNGIFWLSQNNKADNQRIQGNQTRQHLNAIQYGRRQIPSYQMRQPSNDATSAEILTNGTQEHHSGETASTSMVCSSLPFQLNSNPLYWFTRRTRKIYQDTQKQNMPLSIPLQDYIQAMGNQRYGLSPQTLGKCKIAQWRHQK